MLSWKERRAEVVLPAAVAAVLPHEHVSPLFVSVAEEEEEKCGLFSRLEKEGFPLLG